MYQFPCVYVGLCLPESVAVSLVALSYVSVHLAPLTLVTCTLGHAHIGHVHNGSRPPWSITSVRIRRVSRSP